MPEKETTDAAALEYGIVLAATKKLREEQQAARQEKAEIQTENAALLEQRSMLNDEIAKTQNRKEEVAQGVLEAQKELRAAKKMKMDEVDAEKRIVENQRRKMTETTQELATVEKTLKARTADVEERERQLRIAQGTNESMARGNAVEVVRLDEMEKELHERERHSSERGKILEARELEAERMLRKASDMETAALNAQETSREDMRRAIEERRGINTVLYEAKDTQASTRALLQDIQRFCNVAQESVRFIQNNVKNYPVIDQYFRDAFPTVVARLSTHTDV